MANKKSNNLEDFKIIDDEPQKSDGNKDFSEMLAEGLVDELQKRVDSALSTLEKHDSGTPWKKGEAEAFVQKVGEEVFGLNGNIFGEAIDELAEAMWRSETLTPNYDANYKRGEIWYGPLYNQKVADLVFGSEDKGYKISPEYPNVKFLNYVFEPYKVETRSGKQIKKIIRVPSGKTFDGTGGVFAVDNDYFLFKSMKVNDQLVYHVTKIAYDKEANTFNLMHQTKGFEKLSTGKKLIDAFIDSVKQDLELKDDPKLNVIHCDEKADFSSNMLKLFENCPFVYSESILYLVGEASRMYADDLRKYADDYTSHADSAELYYKEARQLLDPLAQKVNNSLNELDPNVLYQLKKENSNVFSKLVEMTETELQQCQKLLDANNSLQTRTESIKIIFQGKKVKVDITDMDKIERELCDEVEKLKHEVYLWGAVSTHTKNIQEDYEEKINSRIAELESQKTKGRALTVISENETKEKTNKKPEYEKELKSSIKKITDGLDKIISGKKHEQRFNLSEQVVSSINKSLDRLISGKPKAEASQSPKNNTSQPKSNGVGKKVGKFLDGIISGKGR